MTRDPADIIEQLHRLRDLAQRLLDPRDLGRNAHRDIRRAAAVALHGDDRSARKTFPTPETRR